MMTSRLNCNISSSLSMDVIQDVNINDFELPLEEEEPDEDYYYNQHVEPMMLD